MNASVEDVREALRDLADQGRPVDLSAAAMRKARWIRLRRRSYAALAVVVVVALCGPVVKVLRLPSGLESGTTFVPADLRSAPSVTGPMIALPGGWMVGGGPGMTQPWIYNRKTHRYQAMPYEVAIPAPIGNLVFVARSDGWAGVVDLRLNQINELQAAGSGDFSLGPVQWSFDGLRLLHRDGEGRVFVTEAVSGTKTKILEICKACTELLWLPGEREVAASLSADVFDGMQVYSVQTGAKLRKVPWARATRTGFATDGKRLIAEAKAGSVCVIDAATNVTMSSFANGTRIDARAVYWATEDVVLAVAHGGVAAYSLNAEMLDFFPWPQEFRDDELRKFTLIRQ